MKRSPRNTIAETFFAENNVTNVVVNIIPRPDDQENPYTKRDFIQDYVMNRAKGHAGGMFAKTVIDEAKKAWDMLESTK